MEREDIVLKNLAQEISFSKHEFLRLNKLDQQEYNKILEGLDFDKVNAIVEQLMRLLQEDNPIKEYSSRIPFGTILINGQFPIHQMIDYMAKAFKTGNRIIISSKLNASHSYQFINKACQSVLASQGHNTNHIQFLELEHATEIQADLCIWEEPKLSQNEVLELLDFTKLSILEKS